MLQNSWPDFPYKISSLGDRRPVDDDDEVIVVAGPDPQGSLQLLTSFSKLPSTFRP